jgi:hypothetical protein
MNEPIATRTFTCLADGKVHEVRTSLFTPVEIDGAYECRFKIESSSIDLALEVTEVAIYGQDAVQAIQLAMFILGSTLLTLDKTSQWQWLGQDKLGLPLSAI